MKRTRRASGSGKGSQSEGTAFAFGNAPAPPPTWAEAIKDKPDSEFKSYAMTATFSRDDLVSHAKFGKGVVTMVDGSRVEILFEDGARKLSHAGT